MHDTVIMLNTENVTLLCKWSHGLIRKMLPPPIKCQTGIRYMQGTFKFLLLCSCPAAAHALKSIDVSADVSVFPYMHALPV